MGKIGLTAGLGGDTEKSLLTQIVKHYTVDLWSPFKIDNKTEMTFQHMSHTHTDQQITGVSSKTWKLPILFLTN